MTRPPTMQPPASPLLELIDGSFDLRDRTRELYRECVEHFVRFMGHGNPALYTSADVSRWILHLLKDRQPQTVNVFRKAIRYASKQWVNQAGKGGVREDFTAKVNKIKTQPATPRDPLTYDEAHRLLATCESTDKTKPRDQLLNRRDRLLMILALRTGLRRHGLASIDIARIRISALGNREVLVAHARESGVALTRVGDHVGARPRRWPKVWPVRSINGGIAQRRFDTT